MVVGHFYVCLHFVFPLFVLGSGCPLNVSCRGAWGGPCPPASIGDLALAPGAAAGRLCLLVRPQRPFPWGCVGSGRVLPGSGVHGVSTRPALTSLPCVHESGTGGEQLWGIRNEKQLSRVPEGGERGGRAELGGPPRGRRPLHHGRGPSRPPPASGAASVPACGHCSPISSPLIQGHLGLGPT